MLYCHCLVNQVELLQRSSDTLSLVLLFLAGQKLCMTEESDDFGTYHDNDRC
jgi:hypothetical protein